jgi:hypothetical protein
MRNPSTVVAVPSTVGCIRRRSLPCHGPRMPIAPRLFLKEVRLEQRSARLDVAMTWYVRRSRASLSCRFQEPKMSPIRCPRFESLEEDF